MATYDIESLFAGEYQDTRDDASFTPSIGDEYEIAQGVYGELAVPTLAAREAYDEANEPVQDCYADSEEAQQAAKRIQSSDLSDEEAAQEFTKMLKDGVTQQEMNAAIRRAACEQAQVVLDFDGEAPDVDEMVPSMATLVRNHFMKLRPATPENGTA